MRQIKQDIGGIKEVMTATSEGITAPGYLLSLANRHLRENAVSHCELDSCERLWIPAY